MRAPIVLLAGFLAACGGTESYVRSVSPADAETIAPAIADYLSKTLPTGSSVAVSAAKNDPVFPVLVADIDREQLIQSPGGTPVQYIVTPFDNGVLVRISVAEKNRGTRYFLRAPSGALTPFGPLTVMQP
jgi:hypothetical protein